MSANRYAALLLCVVPSLAGAQQAQRPDSSKLDFSGVMYANYHYRGEDAAESANKIDLDRVYLNFRMPAGPRASIRVTTDIYQQTAGGSDAYYRGWSLRAKYAYLQYNYLSRPAVRAQLRAGLLQTVFFEQDETFWPRWIATSPTDRASFFSAADAGIANTLTFPLVNTEVYSTITNGPGYTSREIDRFKDFATRVTISPWKSDATNPLRGVALTAWGYKGATASRFVNGGPGQVGTVGDALDRSRWGVHAGSLSPRLVLAAQFAAHMDERDAGDNTLAAPRSVEDSTGRLVSAYAVVRPFPSAGEKSHPLSVLARFDRVNTTTDIDSSYDIFIGGLLWDFSTNVSMSADYQEATRRKGNPFANTRTWFAHLMVRF